MAKNKFIQLKAAFLAVVFSINTLVGFACAIGINMDFSFTHDHAEDAIETAEHVHGNNKNNNQHTDTKPHHETHEDHHKSKEGKDDCCNDKVTHLAQIDKFVPCSIFVITPIFIALVSLFYNSDILFPSQVTPSVKHFVRSYHPPISDIRIIIQSFLI